MSITAGYLPSAFGTYTSPTRLTPSLAGIVTSEYLTEADAGAAAARRAAGGGGGEGVAEQRGRRGFPDRASGSAQAWDLSNQCRAFCGPAAASPTRSSTASHSGTSASAPTSC